MNPEISPIVPEFVPDEFAAPYVSEARETVRRSAIHLPRPSQTSLFILRDVLLTVTIALGLFTTGAGALFLLNAAAPLGRIVALVALALALLWPLYSYAANRRTR